LTGHSYYTYVLVSRPSIGMSDSHVVRQGFSIFSCHTKSASLHTSVQTLTI